MKKLIFMIFFFVLVFFTNAQHLADFVQYQFNGILFNPAYAGNKDALNLTALYRNQWVGVEGAPEDLSFTAHSPLKNKKMNLGLVFEDERFGVTEHYKTSIVYAYRLHFESSSLSFGLQGGIDTYRSNWSRLRTHDDGDPGLVAAPVNSSSPTAAAGIYFESNKLYFGFAMPSLLGGNGIQHQNLALNSGCVLDLNASLKLKPTLMLRYVRASQPALNLAATLYYKEVVGLGLGYTVLNNYMAFLDVRINDQFRFGYGYDYPCGKIRAGTSGSQEVMLRYLFRYKTRAESPRYF